MKITTNADDIARRLEAFSRHVDDVEPMLQDVGADWLSRVQMGFRMQRDPWGSRWKSLARSTLQRRRGRSASILSDTARLKRSFSYRVSGGKMSLGSNVEYAATHQYGARKGSFGIAVIRRKLQGGGRSKSYRQALPWGDIPARPMLPIRGGRVRLPRAWEKAMRKAMYQHIHDGLR